MDEEKDYTGKLSASGSPAPPLATPEEERRLVRKIDLRILPITCLLYLCACEFFFFSVYLHRVVLFAPLVDCHIDLDRTNLGNARLQGLPQETLNGDPTGILYNWVNSIFYFSYVSFIVCLFCCGVLPALAWMLICVFVFKIARTDSLSSSCNDIFQALSTIVLDGSDCYRMGDLFHFVG